jgi:hypothetical protein
MLTKVRVLATAAALIAIGSTGALAELNPAGTYMGPSLNPRPAPVATAPAPMVTAQASYGYRTTTMPNGYTAGTIPNYYSPYGAASPVITGNVPEGSGTNPYQSAVGTSGHAPTR